MQEELTLGVGTLGKAASRWRPLPSLFAVHGVILSLALSACDKQTVDRFRAAYLLSCHDHDVELWIDGRKRDCDCAADVWEAAFSGQEREFILAVFEADIDDDAVDRAIRRYGFDDAAGAALLKRIGEVAMQADEACAAKDG